MDENAARQRPAWAADGLQDRQRYVWERTAATQPGEKVRLCVRDFS